MPHQACHQSFVRSYHGFHHDLPAFPPSFASFASASAANCTSCSWSLALRLSSLIFSRRASRAFFSMSFLLRISMARVMPSFSIWRLYWQYWYMPTEPNTHAPTAQLHAVQTLAVEYHVNDPFCFRLSQASHDLPPSSARTPPMPNPDPIPVISASRTQGFL